MTRWDYLGFLYFLSPSICLVVITVFMLLFFSFMIQTILWLNIIVKLSHMLSKLHSKNIFQNKEETHKIFIQSCYFAMEHLSLWRPF